MIALPFSAAEQARPNLTAPMAALRLPDSLPEPGLLVGWSLERQHPRTPFGFSFGPPETSPETGYIDPILLNGEGHLITVAPTGAGKGVGCIIPAVLRHQGPIIVIDPKGENAMVTAKRRRALGDQVVILDPMGVTDQPADRFNPLDLIQPDQLSGVDDAAALVAALLPENLAGDKNEYWISRARQLLLACLLHVVTDLPKEKRTLTELRRIVNTMAADQEAGARRLEGSRHPEARLIAENLRIGARETLGGIISFAQEGVDFLRGPQLQAAVEATSFPLEGVTRGDPLSIYLVVPPHMLVSHGRFLRLWISGLLTLVMRRRARPARPTLFILDEAAQLGTLDELRVAVTLLRGYGLQTWSFWQDVSQLQALYPRDWQTMVNNCKVFQAFGANNLAAAKQMADVVGFISGEAMLALDQDEMLLQIAGDEAVVAQLPNYLTDPAFAGQFSINPIFDADRDPVPARKSLKEYLRPGRRQESDQALEFGLGVNPVDQMISERIIDVIGS